MARGQLWEMVLFGLLARAPVASSGRPLVGAEGRRRSVGLLTATGSGGRHRCGMARGQLWEMVLFGLLARAPVASSGQPLVGAEGRNP